MIFLLVLVISVVLAVALYGLWWAMIGWDKES